MGNEKNYIEYISKLIDRNLQKKQANGFTLWAISGVLFYLVFDLIDKIPNIILLWPHMKLYSFLTIVITINFIVLISYLIIGLTHLSSIKKRKFQTKFNNSNLIIYYICLLMIILAIVNYKSVLILREKNIFNLPFYLWGMFFMADGLYPFIQNASDLFNKNKLKKTVLKFDSQTSIEVKAKFLIILIISLLSLFAIFYYIYFSNIVFPLDIKAIFYPVKIAIELFVIFTLSIVFMTQFFELKRNNWLENLEQEICVYGLNETEIKDRLEKEYIGQSIEKWFSEERRNVEPILNTFEENYNEFKMHIDKLNLIKQFIIDVDLEDKSIKDKNIACLLDVGDKLRVEEEWFENKGDLFTGTITNSYNSYSNFCRNFIEKMDGIIIQPILEEQEKHEITRINKYYIDSLKTFEDKFNDIHESLNDLENTCNQLHDELSKKLNSSQDDEINSESK